VVVIDTNIIFSILLDKHSAIRDKFFERDVKYYAPNFVFVEIFNNKEKLLKHSKLSDIELLELMYRIFQKISFVSEATISKDNKKKAFRLCKDIDEDDTPFVALALEFEAEIWSGDKKLNIGLKKKGFNRFFKQ